MVCIDDCVGESSGAFDRANQAAQEAFKQAV